MEAINPKNDFKLMKIIYKTFFSFCALCCFIAVLPLPSLYYLFLRIFIFLAAGVVVYYFGRQKELHWVIVFGIILILFNPIIPIHFYFKSIWIPIDIVTGILFLLLVVIGRKQKELPKEVATESLPQPKIFSRDRIIKTSSKNNNNE